MATQYDNAIQQLYVAYFNRPADAAGLAHWAGFMANGGTVAQISAAFSQSLEYQVEYSQSTNAGIVNAVYQNLFGRPAEETGLAFWVKALTDKTMTVDNMVTTIAAGAQTTDKVAFDSKVVVATAFTNALDTDAEKAGYSGANANKAAKALLSTITTAAQATAAVVPATLNASVATVVKAATPFTLESGLAALNVADKAIVDFLAGAKIDVNNDGKDDEDVDADAIEANLLAAKVTLADNIDDTSFATRESAAVRAALIEEQQEINAAALKVQQDELKAANTAVAGVAGLANAVAANTSAVAAEADAIASQKEAVAAFNLAFTSLVARNTTANITVNAAGDTITSTPAGGTATTLATISATTGEWELAAGVNATTYAGLTAAIAAGNTVVAANDEVVEADLAQMFTELNVDIRDQTAAGVTALAAITFSEITPATAGKPTVAEITNELSALEAAGTDTGAFITQVKAFLTANVAPKAGLVVSEQADVAAAQKVITDLATAVEAEAEAQALSDELESLIAARKVISDDFITAKYKAPVTVDGSLFATTDADIFVAGDVNGSISSFGRSGDDVLYIGSGYTLNTGALTTGNNAALEVFFTQQGNNTIVTIETETFGSSTSSDAKVVITLTGVDAADLTFENGIITL